jgi:hypothetical protein
MNKHTLKLTTPSEREIVMTRDFDAPRHLVFAAWTKPELRRWHGVFGGWSMVTCEFEAWVGGSYQFVWQGADGQRMRMSGVIRFDRLRSQTRRQGRRFIRRCPIDPLQLGHPRRC